MASAVPSPLDLSQIPLVPPPPGVKSNLVDPPEDSHLATIIFHAVLLPITTAFVLGRLYHNLFVVKRTGWDDAFSVTAMVLIKTAANQVKSIANNRIFKILSFTLSALVINRSFTFRYIWNIPASWFDTANAQIGVSRDFTLGPATFFAKSAVVLLYLKVFATTSRSFRIRIYTTLVFLFCLYFVNIPLTGYYCVPHGSETWLTPSVSLRCAKLEVFGAVQGSLGLVVDLWIFWLPLKIIWKLNMSRRKKVQLMTIFATGVLACAASAAALALRIILCTSEDETWIVNILYLTVVLEIDTSIIVGCMPAFASLCKHASTNKTLSIFLHSLAHGQWSRLTTRTGVSRVQDSNESHDRFGSKKRDYIELMDAGRPGIPVVNGAHVEHGKHRPTDVSLLMNDSSILKSVNMEITYDDEGKRVPRQLF